MKKLSQKEFKAKYGDMVQISPKVPAVFVKQGEPGKDFNFEESRAQIQELLNAFILEIKDSLKLRFSELTDEEKFLLKGEPGKPGTPGKDFNFGEVQPFIERTVTNFLKSITDDLKLKFSDLTEEEKNSLKLKYSDLTDEEKEELRGPRRRMFGGAFPAYERRVTVSGTQDGSNKSFTIANTLQDGSEKMFFNGILQTSGADATYILSGYDLTIQAGFPAPTADDKIEVFGVY